jgi:iron complex outermembrane receptor protein
MRAPVLLVSLLGAGLTLGLPHATADAAQAGTGTIRVEVVAAAAGPAEGATVSANGVSAATDASGAATLTLPFGSVSVVASRDGYHLATARVDVVAGAERTVRLVMVPAPQAGGTVVMSTRLSGAIEDQALPVAVLGRDRIDARMPRAAGDSLALFHEMAGLRVQTTSPVLGTASVRIRGLPERYTRLLSDGVPLYGDRPGGHALLRIPAMDLERVEVVKGVAGALFGADALAGVVNLVSRKPASASSEILLSQSARGATDGLLWISSPGTGSWSRTFLASGHRQDETDVNDDGWSDLPGYARGVVRPRVFWNNGQGRSASGVATVTFETREGGSTMARESLETRTADGALFGEMPLGEDYVLAGAGVLFIQSRTHDFSDRRERERFQTATIEITIRRATSRHTWLAGLAADWYALRSADALPSGYVSTRPGIFVHDDWRVAPWLQLSGSARLDHHNLYGVLLSPRGSALVRGGPWAARLSAGRGYFTPRPITGETEAAGLAHLTIDGPLEVETARSLSADVTHETRATAVTLAVFHSRIDDPAQIDRATYTLRNEAEPIVARGVEILGTVRRAPFSLIGTYTHVRTRERGSRDLALTPRHSAGLIAAAAADRGRMGVEVVFTGAQRLDANPYRSTSEPYIVVGLLGEHRVGRWRVFVNADNLTDVRQTRWDPIARPARDVDGRRTVDAWAPLHGRVINAGIRVPF